MTSFGFGTTIVVDPPAAPSVAVVPTPGPRGSDGIMTSVEPGAHVEVDDTDPANPVVSVDTSSITPADIGAEAAGVAAGLVDGEAVARADADAVNADAIAAETARAELVEDGIEDDLANEATARANADNALDGRLDTLEADPTTAAAVADAIVAASTAATAYTDAETARAEAVEAAKADLVAGVVPTSQLPMTTLLDKYPAADQAAMLALTGLNPGDVGVRADTDPPLWMLLDLPASDLANWLHLGVGGGGAVDSVNGQVGVVVLSASDVGADADGAASSALTTAKAYTDGAIVDEVTRADAAYATTAQGVEADSAVQPGDLATVATTGAYSDLAGKPALGTAAAAATTDFDAAGAAAAKVIDSIADADTTHAPSRNAVFAALALKAADSAVVHNSLFDANTILAADTDNIPAALSVAASRIVGRKSTGGIGALTAAEVKTILGLSDTVKRAQGMPLFVYGNSYVTSTGTHCTAGDEYHTLAKNKALMLSATTYGTGQSRIFDSAMWAINGGNALWQTAAPSGSAWPTTRNGIVLLDTSFTDISHSNNSIASAPVAISGGAYPNGVTLAHKALFALISAASSVEQTTGTLSGTWSTVSNSRFSAGSTGLSTVVGDFWSVSVTPAQSGDLAGKVYFLTYLFSDGSSAALNVLVDGVLQSTFTPTAFEAYTGLAGSSVTFIPMVIEITLPVDAAAHTVKIVHAGSAGQAFYADAIKVPKTSLPQIFVMQSPDPVANGSGLSAGLVTTWKNNRSVVETAVQSAIASFPNAHWVTCQLTASGMYSGDGFHPNDRGMKERSEDFLAALESYLAGFAVGSEPDALYTLI